MKVKELIKELLDCDPKADVFFETPTIIYPIDYIEGFGSSRVTFKWDNTKEKRHPNPNP